MNNEHFKLKYLKYKKKYLELSQMDGGYFGGATGTHHCNFMNTHKLSKKEKNMELLSLVNIFDETDKELLMGLQKFSVKQLEELYNYIVTNGVSEIKKATSTSPKFKGGGGSRWGSSRDIWGGARKKSNFAKYDKPAPPTPPTPPVAPVAPVGLVKPPGQYHGWHDHDAWKQKSNFAKYDKPAPSAPSGPPAQLTLQNQLNMLKPISTGQQKNPRQQKKPHHRQQKNHQHPRQQKNHQHPRQQKNQHHHHKN